MVHNALSSVDEIVEEEPEQTKLEQVYAEYLVRLEEDRLKTEKLFESGITFLVTLTANSANSAIIMICIDFGVNWFSASVFGFGVGLIPAAMHFNNAGVDLSSEYKVKKISSLILAGFSVVGAFSVSYSSGGEKRTLIDYTNVGIKEASREISNYEVKISPWNGVNFLFSYHGLEAIGSGILPALFLAFIWKWLDRRR